MKGDKELVGTLRGFDDYVNMVMDAGATQQKRVLLKSVEECRRRKDRNTILSREKTRCEGAR